MPDLYRNTFLVPSTRLQTWNYSNAGYYFITICTYQREEILASILNAQVQLTPIGKIVQDEWERSFSIRQELVCDEFIIMPNHMHAIIGIKNMDRDVCHVERDARRASLRGIKREGKSISSFIAGFKSSATRRINELRAVTGFPVWQTRFYDHVIRTDAELSQIREYILNNPAQWANDEENRLPENVRKRYFARRDARRASHEHVPF